MGKGTVISLALVSIFAGPLAGQVRITEVQPNPNGPDTAEWVELYNAGASPQSIAGWSLNDFGHTVPTEYAFPAGAALAGGEVIIVARQATAYMVMALSEVPPYAVLTPHWELALGGADEPSVANLTVSVVGTGSWALSNLGDGVQLRDDNGTVVSTAEWGTGVSEVPGDPVGAPSSGESIGRIDTTGDSATDFIVLAVPTPGSELVPVELVSFTVE